MGAPATLPADFQGWDKAPATLPADFKQWDDAAPNAGLAPPAGGPGSIKVEPGPEGLEADPNNPHPAAGMPGAWGNRPVEDRDLIPGEIAGGAAALATTPVLGPPILRAAWPIAASEGIHQARRIPYVGKMIPPYAEWAPFIFGGGKGKAAEEAPPVEPAPYNPGYRAPRAYYGGQPAEPIPPRSGLQLEGETAQPVEGEYMAPGQAAASPEAPYAPATVVQPRAVEPSPAPYRMGPGEVAPEDVNVPDENILAGNLGVRVPPRVSRGLALPAGSAGSMAESVAAPAARAAAAPDPVLARLSAFASKLPAGEDAEMPAVESRSGPPLRIRGKVVAPDTDLAAALRASVKHAAKNKPRVH